MKKILYLAVAIILSVMLAACGQSDKAGGNSKENSNNSGTTENTEKPETETEVEKEDDSKKDQTDHGEISSDELFNKLAEAQNNLKSFTANITMKQDMDFGGETMATSSTVKMDYISPSEFFQSIHTEANGQNIVMDMYMIGEELYIHETTEDTWMKASDEMLSQLAQMDESQTDPYAQIVQLKEFSDHFEVKSEGDTYVLTIKAGGEEFNEYIKEMALEQLPGEGMDGEELLSGMSINSTDYHIVIDKETYFPISVQVFMDMTIEAEGDKLDMKQDIDMEYTNYNEVKDIKLPDEAKEKAVDINEQFNQ